MIISTYFQSIKILLVIALMISFNCQSQCYFGDVIINAVAPTNQSCGTDLFSYNYYNVLSNNITGGDLIYISNVSVGNTYCFATDYPSDFLTIYEAITDTITAFGLGEICIEPTTNLIKVQINSNDSCGVDNDCRNLFAACIGCQTVNSSDCNANCYNTPVNDIILNAIDLTVQNNANQPLLGTTDCATQSLNTNSLCGDIYNSTQRDVWYKLAVPNNGKVVVKVSQILNTSYLFDFDAPIFFSILSGNSNNLEELDCRDYALNDSIQLQNLIPNDTLLIRVWTEDKPYNILDEDNYLIAPCSFNICAYSNYTMDSQIFCSDTSILDSLNLYGTYNTSVSITLLGASSATDSLNVFSSEAIILADSTNSFLANPNFCAIIQSCNNPIDSITYSDIYINSSNNNGLDIVFSVDSAINTLAANFETAIINIDFGNDTLYFKNVLTIPSGITLNINPITKLIADFSNASPNMLRVGDINPNNPNGNPLGASNVSINGGNWQLNDSITRAAIEVYGPFLNVKINGATVMREKNYAIDSQIKSVGIRIRNGFIAEVSDCTFRNLNFDIQSAGGDPTFLDSLIIINNNAFYHCDFLNINNGNNTGGGFILLQGLNKNVYVKQNIIHGFWQYELGGHLYANTSTNLQENIYILDNIFYGGNVNEPHQGDANGATADVLAIRKTDGFEVRGNAIFNSGEFGITAIFGSKNGTIHHNTVVRCDGSAILIGANTQVTVENIDVFKNYIYKGVMDREGFTCNYNFNCANISGCNCSFNAWHNLRVWNTNNCSITENVVERMRTFGLYIRSTDTSNFIHNKNFYDTNFVINDRETIAYVPNNDSGGFCTAVYQIETLSLTERDVIINDCPPNNMIDAVNRVLELR